MKVRTTISPTAGRGTTFFIDDTIVYSEQSEIPERSAASSSQVLLRRDVLLLQGQYVAHGDGAAPEGLMVSVDPRAVMQRLAVRQINDFSHSRSTTTGITSDDSVVG